MIEERNVIIVTPNDTSKQEYYDGSTEISADVCKYQDDEKPEVKIYKYRWVILLLYGLTMATTGNVICCLYNISDIVCDFYHVSKSELLFAASLCNGITIAVLIPAGFIPSKYGLRASMVFGSGSLAICGGLFLAAAHPEGYIMFVVSLVFAGISSAIFLQLTSEISSVWFPSHQHTLATGINFQMQAVGVGIGYAETAVLFNNSKEMPLATLHARIRLVFYLQSSMCILVFFLVLIFYVDKPKLPPSISQAKRQVPGTESFWTIIKELAKLFKNFKYIVLAVTFGMNFTVGVVYPLIINSLLTPNYENSDKKVGIVGILVVIGSSIGVLLFSSIVDKTKHYKVQVMLQLIVSLGLVLTFTISLLKIYSFYIVSVSIVLCWSFYSSTLSILTEMIAEVTYPIDNSITLILCFFLGNIFGISITQISGWLADNNKEYLIAWMLVGTIGIQLLFLVGLKIDTKRSNIDDVKEDPIPPLIIS